MEVAGIQVSATKLLEYAELVKVNTPVWPAWLISSLTKTD